MIELYIKEIMYFLQTITIKSTLLAEHAGRQEAMRVGKTTIPDTENPYYLRLAGQYASTDIPMTLQSIDDGSTILLSRGMEVLHPKTANVHKLPNEEYLRLCGRYPTQIDLIKSIVYPISNIEDAINADDMTILRTDPTILEQSERESMLNTFKELVNYFKQRWIIPVFAEVEEYYPLAIWATLWAVAPTILFSQRLKNLKTNNVHPFHIWEYLKSKGLDDYRTVLDTRQQLFLYHNMRFINRERGKTSTLNIIADNLLRDHGITLNTKSIVVDTSGSESNCKVLPEIVSENIAGNAFASNSDMYTSTESVSSITQRLHDNGLDLDASQERKVSYSKLFGSSTSTYIPTKLVELTKIDLNTEYVDLFYATIFHLFLFNYQQGNLAFNTTITLPIIGNARLFTIGEAAALMHYCTFGERGTVMPVSIPAGGVTFFNFYSRNTQIPNTFWFGGHKYNLSNLIDVETFTARIPIHPGAIESSEHMMIYFDLVFSAIKEAGVLLRLNGDAVYHAAREHIYSHMIREQMVDIDLIPGHTTYQSWFDSNETLQGIMAQLHNMGHIEAKGYYESFFNNIFDELFPVQFASYATPMGLNSNAYAAMKKLFMQLCSYNIAFIDSDRTQKSHIITNPIISYPKYITMTAPNYITCRGPKSSMARQTVYVTERSTADHFQLTSIMSRRAALTEMLLKVLEFEEDTKTITIIYSTRNRSIRSKETTMVREYLHSNRLATDENYS